MRVEPTIAGARARVHALRQEGRRVAFVPTMGALHDGHLSLVRRARTVADAVVASIFANPLQFAPGEDYARYPRAFDADAAALAEAGTALLFAPTADEMYPGGSEREVTRVEPGPAGHDFEGAIRPGHFAGVLTVVAKLLNVLQPDIAVFGQKDLQQVAVVRAMVRDLDIDVEIVVAPTARERDGLALSSRNRYLSPDERARAPVLYAALRAAEAAVLAGEWNPAAVEAAGLAVLRAEPALVPDYFAVVDPVSFERTTAVRPGDAIVTAARLGTTRLLDNLILQP